MPLKSFKFGIVWYPRLYSKSHSCVMCFAGRLSNNQHKKHNKRNECAYMYNALCTALVSVKMNEYKLYEENRIQQPKLIQVG